MRRNIPGRRQSTQTISAELGLDKQQALCIPPILSAYESFSVIDQLSIRLALGSCEGNT